MYKFHIVLFNIFFCFCFSQDADHLIFKRVCLAPNEAEMIEIYNPTSVDINLNTPGNGSYFLTDGTDPTQSEYYYNIVTSQSAAWSGNITTDFFISFPENLVIGAGESLSIGMHDANTFQNYYNYSPETTLADIEPTLYYSMQNPPFDNGGLGFNVLGDDSEVLILFYWDEASSIVEDVDYFLWGNATYAVDKSAESGYLADTPIAQQNFIPAANPNYSYFRNSNEESGESQSGGNGITGHDETSEIFEISWSITQNPEVVFGCTDSIANNYDGSATSDDGSCTYNWGCMDSSYDNYDSEATMDQGSCINFTHTIGDITSNLSGNLNSQVQISGKLIEYTQITSTFWIIGIIDDEDNKIEIIPGQDGESWQIMGSYLEYLVDPYSTTEYIVSVKGTVGEYQGKAQLSTVGKESSIDDYTRYHIYGEKIDKPISKANIVVAPYVVIPSIGERINFIYSYPSESRVIIRIYSLDGRFITSLVDRYDDTAGTVIRAEDSSDWDGKDHLGQIVDPGTYLIHIEASNFLTGATSVDTAPIVVGVPN